MKPGSRLNQLMLKLPARAMLTFKGGFAIPRQMKIYNHVSQSTILVPVSFYMLSVSQRMQVHQAAFVFLREISRKFL